MGSNLLPRTCCQGAVAELHAAWFLIQAGLSCLCLPIFHLMPFVNGFEFLIALGYKEVNGVPKNTCAFKHFESPENGSCDRQWH